MSAKISKEDTDRSKSGRFLLAALTRQGPHVASLLAGLATPHQREDDPDPGFLGTVVALARRLESVLERLAEAGNELYAADAELMVLRLRRDASTQKVAGAIVRLRRKTLAEYEDPNLEGLALQSPRVYRAHPLLRQIEMVDASFEGDDVATFLGKPAYDEPADLRPAVAKAVETAGELEAVLDQINEGRRRHDEALIARDEARAEYDELFVYTARTFEGYCRLAGLKELARRVRPSVSRPGRAEEEPNEESLQSLASGGRETISEDAPALVGWAPPTIRPDAAPSHKTDEPTYGVLRPPVGQAPPDDSRIPIASDPPNPPSYALPGGSRHCRTGPLSAGPASTLRQDRSS